MMKGFRRVPAQRAAAATRVQPKTFPAPVRGWVTATSLVKPVRESALVLDNGFPEQDCVRTRGGSKRWAKLPGAVVSFMTYVGAARERMFAATGTALFDVSTIKDGTLAADAAVVSGLHAGYFSSANFSTEGGEFLIAANGADPLMIYDATTWHRVTASSTPYAITFAGSSSMTTSKITHVGAYRNRLFFVRGGSMELWYLPVNSLAGTANRLNLAGVFKKGGAILFTGTWSMDAGDGLDDKLVVVTTGGEAAVYQGSNPADADDWTIVGRYDISPALGLNATMQAGGDLLVAAHDGLIPISAAISKDPAALALTAISKPIEPEWKAAVVSNRARPWEIAKWTRMGMAVVSVPTVTANDQGRRCFVVNLQTGAWARYTGWDARCMAVHKGWLYFGTSDGRVLQAEVGPDDDGTPYDLTMVLAFSDMGAGGQRVTVHQARATFRSVAEIDPLIAVATNYLITLPDPPAQPVIANRPSLWDVGRWDEAVWDAADTYNVQPSLWQSIGQSGYAIAPTLQMAGNGLRADLVEITMTYDAGTLVTGA